MISCGKSIKRRRWTSAISHVRVPAPMKPAHRNSAAWIAIFAMALQALWPLIAQAKPAAPSLLVPVCTVDGVTHYIDLAAGAVPLEKRSAVDHQHCQLCAPGSDRVAVLPVPPIPVLIVEPGRACVPVQFVLAVPEATPYPPALPRAPPEFS